MKVIILKQFVKIVKIIILVICFSFLTKINVERDNGTVFNDNSNDSDENKKFDKIFSDFPTGLNLSKGEIETIFKSKKMLSKWKYYPAISIDWLFVNVVLSEMKEKGFHFCLSKVISF